MKPVPQPFLCLASTRASWGAVFAVRPASTMLVSRRLTEQAASCFAYDLEESVSLGLAAPDGDQRRTVDNDHAGRPFSS
jgi:hypothetical protein